MVVGSAFPTRLRVCQTISLLFVGTYVSFATGQLRCTTHSENIHFHLRFVCISTKYPNFTPDMLLIKEEHKQFLLQEHKERIRL